MSLAKIWILEVGLDMKMVSKTAPEPQALSWITSPSLKGGIRLSMYWMAVSLTSPCSSARSSAWYWVICLGWKVIVDDRVKTRDRTELFQQDRYVEKSEKEISLKRWGVVEAAGNFSL